MNWQDLFTPEEALAFVRLYEPRLWGTFGSSEMWPFCLEQEHPPFVKVKEESWKWFLCRVSHKEFRCWEDDIERPDDMHVEYTNLEAVLEWDSTKDSELLQRFLSTETATLTLSFKSSTDEDALLYVSTCAS